jgi:hypothetical protein
VYYDLLLKHTEEILPFIYTVSWGPGSRRKGCACRSEAQMMAAVVAAGT